MQTISLKHHLNLVQPLKKGFIDLFGATGKRYRSLALEVPGYGMVPCSKKLRDNFSTSPEDLMLVISDNNDEDKPVTSDIWVTVNNIVAVFDWDRL